MTLEQYLISRNIRPAEFAKRLNVFTSTVTRLLRHERRPSIDMVVKIEAESLGQVAMEDWMKIAVKEHRRKSRKRPNPGSKRART